MKISQEIPKHLEAEAEAARAWFSTHSQNEFKLTGIVDVDRVGTSSPKTLQLILCGQQHGQDVCLREVFTVTSGTHPNQYDVEHLADTNTSSVASPAPDLDPPSGTRTPWVNEALAKHKFVVLLFYRGLW